MHQEHHHGPDHDCENCEHCGPHAHHKGGKGGFTDGILLGTIIGGILGVLFAPEEGEKTRKKLKKIADDTDVVEKIEDLIKG